VRNILQVTLSVATVLMTVAVMAVFLIGLPELTYVASGDSAWPGEHPIRLLPILLHFETPDPMLCFEASAYPGCLREKLLAGSLFDSLSAESGAVLVRNFGWLLYCALAYVVLRMASYFRTWRGLMNDVANDLLWWVPTIHGFWVVVALAGAYAVSLL